MSDKNEYRRLLAEAEKLLTDATDTALIDRVALRDAVCDYYAVERNKGNSVESVRNSVEAILIRAEVRVGKLNGHKELAQELVNWCQRDNPKLV